MTSKHKSPSRQIKINEGKEKKGGVNLKPSTPPPPPPIGQGGKTQQLKGYSAISIVGPEKILFHLINIIRKRVKK